MYCSSFLPDYVSNFLVLKRTAGDLDLDFDDDTLPPLCCISSKAEFFLEWILTEPPERDLDFLIESLDLDL